MSFWIKQFVINKLHISFFSFAILYLWVLLDLNEAKFEKVKYRVSFEKKSRYNPDTKCLDSF